eukprot:9555974-Lingulodinium_polyedra.AAC.1
MPRPRRPGHVGRCRLEPHGRRCRAGSGEPGRLHRCAAEPGHGLAGRRFGPEPGGLVGPVLLLRR